MSVAKAQALPLTERILARLPGPRFAWVAAWVVLITARPLVVFAVVNLVGVRAVGWGFVANRLLPHIALGYMALMAMWMARTIEPALARLTTEDETATDHIVLGTRSIRGPVLMTLAVTLVLTIRFGVEYGPLIAALTVPNTLVMLLPITTGLWAYLAFLIGLDRLGRRKLALDPFPQDRSLGLRPIGTMAFTEFLIFAAALIPFIVISAEDPLSLGISLTSFLAGVVVFFLSLNQLHRQMVAAKQHYLDWARSLYSEAFGPMRSSGSLETLQAQALQLSAAEALERRAYGIQEWPFDEAMRTRIVTIVTSVVAAVVARLVLGRFGL